MPIPHPLPEPLVELVAQRFRLIGEPTRIRLLDRLREAELSVGELTEALDATQQNVSKHLSALHLAGVVTRRKDGNHVVYTIADRSVYALCEMVCGGLQQQADRLTGILEAHAEPVGAAR